MSLFCSTCGCKDLPMFGSKIICKECGSEIITLHVDESDTTTFNVNDDMFPISSKTLYVSKKAWNMDVYRSNLYDNKIAKEKNKKLIFDIIQYTLNENGNYTNEIISAKILYDKYLQSPKYKPSRRGNITKNIAGIVYYAFKENKQCITYKDLAAMFDISPSDVGDGVKNVSKVLFEGEQHMEEKVFISTSDDMIEKYGNILDVSDEIKEKAKKISVMANEKALFTKCTPSSSVIGTIYYVILLSGVKITESEIIEKTQISSVTMNKIRRALTNAFGTLC